MSLPQAVQIVEVGPRDGLQNEKRNVDLAIKVQLVDDLSSAGVSYIETGSFVNPKWVPQMADSEAVFEKIHRAPSVRYAALTPNVQGLERAVAAGADEVAIFAVASETFSQKNINCSVAESLARFSDVMQEANAANLPVRGYISCVLGCPYEGAIKPEAVAGLTQELLQMGCYEVALADTIGIGSAGDMLRLLDAVQKGSSAKQLAVHCHDTYGQALSNILVALQRGIATVDAAVAGLGGCPFAPGASGNVATENVVYMLKGLGIETGINLDKLIAAGLRISAALGRQTASSVALAHSRR